jgi:AcrR family transcriptional regulator
MFPVITQGLKWQSGIINHMTERTIGIRKRIIQAAAELLARDGREAVSTRAVSAAAGVQAPTIYRQFGDMQGLLNAVADEVFAEHIRQKASIERTDDPLDEMRRRWDMHITFGVANPYVYMLLYNDPRAADKPAKRAAATYLYEAVTRFALSGRLRVSIPHAARLISAAADGVTLSLIATPLKERDLTLSDTMREAVIAALTIAPLPDGSSAETSGPERMAAYAIALRAMLAEGTDVLSPAELHLLGEWLDRLAGTDG